MAGLPTDASSATENERFDLCYATKQLISINQTVNGRVGIGDIHCVAKKYTTQPYMIYLTIAVPFQ